MPGDVNGYSLREREQVNKRQRGGEKAGRKENERVLTSSTQQTLPLNSQENHIEEKNCKDTKTRFLFE